MAPGLARTSVGRLEQSEQVWGEVCGREKARGKSIFDRASEIEGRRAGRQGVGLRAC